MMSAQKRRPLRRACGNPAATLVEGGSIDASAAIRCASGSSSNAKTVGQADACFGVAPLSFDRGHIRRNELRSAETAPDNRVIRNSSPLQTLLLSRLSELNHPYLGMDD